MMINSLLLGFPGGSVVKNCLPMQETEVQSLGQEDPLDKGMTTHSSILAWRISWTEKPGRLQSIGLHREAWQATVHRVAQSQR